MTTVASGHSGPAISEPASLMSHPFTCVTCAIAFRSSELQRTHMRSDWHRYNLKRRVASLPPLSSEIFAEKVLNAQATASATAAKASFEKICQPCQRTYYSENAYGNHIGSQKHRTRVAALANGKDDTGTASVMSSALSLGEPVATENTKDPEVEAGFSKVVEGIKDTNLKDTSASSRPSIPHHSAEETKLERAMPTSATPSAAGADMAPPMPIKRCIFCSYDSPNLKLNIHHMKKFHGMFIPEEKYLVDMEGLTAYLQAKVGQNFECLSCHKLRNSAEAVQTHMRDKGHCMIAFDTEEEMIEIGQFYDFRSTYSDDDDEADKAPPQPRVKLGAKRLPVPSWPKEENEDGWESDSSASDLDDLDDLDDDDIAAIPDEKRRPISHSHGAAAAFEIDGELHLPSGRVAGHRSLAKYFRQNLRNYPLPSEGPRRLLADAPDVSYAYPSDTSSSSSSSDDEPRRGRQVATRSEAGMLGVTDEQKHKVVAVAQKQQRNAARVENQQQSRVERRANKQKHFRDDNFGIYR